MTRPLSSDDPGGVRTPDWTKTCTDEYRHGTGTPTPDHSSLTRIKARLPWEVFQTVFAIVLELVAQHKLLDGRTVGVDATTLEADAAMKSIVRKDTDENWEQYVRRLAAEDGVEIQSKADLTRPASAGKSFTFLDMINSFQWRSPSFRCISGGASTISLIAEIGGPGEYRGNTRRIHSSRPMSIERLDELRRPDRGSREIPS